MINGAASLSSRGPIMSVPVALLMSILERDFETFSFWIGGIINFVSAGSYAPQNSLKGINSDYWEALVLSLITAGGVIKFEV